MKALENGLFSIGMDEGSAKGNFTYLAIKARFFETQEATRTVTKLLGLIEMEVSATGETL